MNPVSPLPALVALTLALITAWAVSRYTLQPTANQSRHASIDGLRGYLAFFVFLHHACIWYFHLRTGQWTEPPSHFYTHLGQSSVALFFMITGFLFFNKLLESKVKPIDWRALYISRLFRITPLYLVLIALVFVIVGQHTQWTQKENTVDLLQHLADWLFFTFPGAPDINRMPQTFTIVAGVTWSLTYEWFFYISLPVWAWLIGTKPQRTWLFGMGVLALTLAVLYHPNGRHLKSFLSGALAAYLVRSEKWRQVASSPTASLLAIAALTTAVLGFPSAYQSMPWVLLTLVFAIISGGNTLFGALTNKASHSLGEMAYSIYLLHGLALYVTLNWAVGATAARALSATQHWLLAILITPMLIILTLLSYRLIEQPGVMLGRTLSNRLKHD